MPCKVEFSKITKQLKAKVNSRKCKNARPLERRGISVGFSLKEEIEVVLAVCCMLPHGGMGIRGSGRREVGVS